MVDDIRLRDIPRPDGNFEGFGGNALDDRFHFRGHRRREEPHRDLLRHGFEDSVQLIAKAEREHLVRLIEDADFQRVQGNDLSPEQVAESPGGGNEDLRTLLHLRDLRPNR